MSITIYHNPRCTKSRQTLELIEATGTKPQIIEYLNNPLTQKEIIDLLQKLGISATELLRKKEAVIKEEGIDISTNAKALAAMAKYPKLIERPIVVKGNKAILGRPPENIKILLQN